MRIGFDARILTHPKAGISTYVCNLVKTLLDLDRDLEIFLFSDGNFSQEYNKFLESTRIQKIVFASSREEKRKWSQRFLPRKLKEYKIDVYHAVWNNAVPFFRNCPCVLTIHDLIPWILGGDFRNKRKEIKYKLQHFLCAQWADLIITVSHKSKEDIVRLCKVKKSKVRVIYLGVEDDFREEVDENLAVQILNKYNVHNRDYFIIPTGVDHPRRNAIFALEGFNEFLKRDKYDFCLVYTGNFYDRSNEYRNLIRRIKELGLQSKIIITGWIPTLELKVLLMNAKISLIPSLYEGFGLPILESFSSGVPVITTDRGAIPEIASGAAVLVNPFDYKYLAAKIEELIKCEDLRVELIEKGKQRVKDFNWRKTAQSTLDVYRTLLPR